MAHSADPEAYRRQFEEHRKQLESNLSPENLRSTLAFAGLYQITHELIVSHVLEDTQRFFGKRLIDDGWDSGEEEYKTSVLSRHKVPFKACLGWLVEMDALTTEQAGRLDDIYKHRNDLSHELMKYIV